MVKLCLTKHHAMKTYGGLELELHAFSTSELDVGESSDSRFGHFIHRERVPD